MLYGDKSQSLGLQKAMFFAREHKKKLYPIEISVFSTIKNLNTNRVGIEDLVVNDNNTVDTLRIDYLKKPLYMEIEETVQKALVDIGKNSINNRSLEHLFSVYPRDASEAVFNAYENINMLVFNTVSSYSGNTMLSFATIRNSANLARKPRVPHHENITVLFAEEIG